MDDQPGPLLVPPREHAPREPIERDAVGRPLPPRTVMPGDARAGHRSALWLLLVLLVIAGLVAWVVLRPAQQTQTGRFQSTGPQPVGTAKIEQGDMPIVLSALGTATPLAMVTVKTQITPRSPLQVFQNAESTRSRFRPIASPDCC